MASPVGQGAAGRPVPGPSRVDPRLRVLGPARSDARRGNRRGGAAGGLRHRDRAAPAAIAQRGLGCEPRPSGAASAIFELHQWGGSPRTRCACARGTATRPAMRRRDTRDRPASTAPASKATSDRRCCRRAGGVLCQDLGKDAPRRRQGPAGCRKPGRGRVTGAALEMLGTRTVRRCPLIAIGNRADVLNPLVICTHTFLRLQRDRPHTLNGRFFGEVAPGED